MLWKKTTRLFGGLMCIATDICSCNELCLIRIPEGVILANHSPYQQSDHTQRTSCQLSCYPHQPSLLMRYLLSISDKQRSSVSRPRFSFPYNAALGY